MDLGLKNKVAIITGGTKGIGGGAAEVLAKEGCNLALVYRSDDEGSIAFCNYLKDEYKIDVLPVKADVTSAQAREEIWEKTFEHFKTVDILINNANCGGPGRGADFLNITYQQ